MRIVHQPLLGHFLEDLRIVFQEEADLFNHAREIEADQGIAVVEPGLKNAAHQRNPVRVGAAGNFLAVKFDLMQDALDEFRVESFGDNLLQGVEDQLFNIRDVGVFDVAQTGAEHHLLEIGFDAGHGRQIFSQPRIDKRPAQGRRGAAHEQAGKNGQRKRRFKVFVFREHPGQIDVGFLLRRLIRIDGIDAGNPPGTGKERLACDGRIHLHPLEAGQHFGQKFQMVRGGDVPIEEKARVGRRIVFAVEIPKLFIGQRRNDVRVAPGVQGIHGVRIKILLNVLIHQRIGR